MATMSDKTKVNETHILTLKEMDGRLQISSLPLEDCSFIENEINAAVENPNKTLLDVQSLFITNFQCGSNAYGYLYPYAYDSSYIQGAMMPRKFSYDEYKSMLDKAVNQKINACSTKDKEALMAEEAYSRKYEYASSCIRYIRQQMLHNGFQDAANDISVKMYSRESIGWNSFIYDITNDLKVCVYTNLGYGHASYFTLTISYKDIIIAPFSHIAKYYKANMTDIIRCTRDYVVDKDSWNPMFEFVQDFANRSLSNPEAFVADYLMNEIDEMMKGLRDIISNTGAVINMFRTQNRRLQDYHNLRLIAPMSDGESQLFEVFENEMPVIFKSEKLVEAAKMLERLGELGKMYSKINVYIDEIKNMIHNISPEIDVTIWKIQKDIEDLVKKEEFNERLKNDLQSQVDIFLAELDGILDRLPEGTDARERHEICQKYANEHPEYVSLTGQLRSIVDEISKLQNQIWSRNSLVHRLSDCTDSFDLCMQKSA